MKIEIEIKMPEQGSKTEYKKQDFESKCCEYMDICESDEDSHYHWNYLKSVYNKLSKRNNVPAEFRPLLSKLEDFMLKHGNVDADEDKVDLQHDTLSKRRY